MAIPRIAIRQKPVDAKWFMSKPGEKMKTGKSRPCASISLRVSLAEKFPITDWKIIYRCG
jgi:hypothetical protein